MIRVLHDIKNNIINIQISVGQFLDISNTILVSKNTYARYFIKKFRGQLKVFHMPIILPIAMAYSGRLRSKVAVSYLFYNMNILN